MKIHIYERKECRMVCLTQSRVKPMWIVFLDFRSWIHRREKSGRAGIAVQISLSAYPHIIIHWHRIIVKIWQFAWTNRTWVNQFSSTCWLKLVELSALIQTSFSLVAVKTKNNLYDCLNVLNKSVDINSI